jgi:hypothetical protein
MNEYGTTGNITRIALEAIGGTLILTACLAAPIFLDEILIFLGVK